MQNLVKYIRLDKYEVYCDCPRKRREGHLVVNIYNSNFLTTNLSEYCP